MDFSNVNFSCGTLSVDINEKEMRQGKKLMWFIFSNVIVKIQILKNFSVVMNRLVSDR